MSAIPDDEADDGVRLHVVVGRVAAEAAMLIPVALP